MNMVHVMYVYELTKRMVTKFRTKFAKVITIIQKALGS